MLADPVSCTAGLGPHYHTVHTAKIRDVSWLWPTLWPGTANSIVCAGTLQLRAAYVLLLHVIMDRAKTSGNFVVCLLVCG